MTEDAIIANTSIFDVIAECAVALYGPEHPIDWQQWASQWAEINVQCLLRDLPQPISVQDMLAQCDGLVALSDDGVLHMRSLNIPLDKAN